MHEKLIAALRRRHESTADELSSYIQSHFGDSLLSLRQLVPLIKEVQRRFRHLPRKQQVNGEFATICGCRTFKKWCEVVLHRTDRAVRYLLKGGNVNRPCAAENVSADSILQYIYRKLEKIEVQEQVTIIARVVHVLDREYL